MAWIVFWFVVGAALVSAIVLSHRARSNTEETIRFGIEKGVITDAAGIAAARMRPTVPWPMWLIVLGVLHLFAGAATGVFAFFIGSFEPESMAPLFGIAAFAAILGVGLVVAGAWLRGALKRAND